MANCGWCGAPAIGEVILEPERWTMHGTVKVISKSALTSPVCRAHRDIVDKQPRFYTCGCYYMDQPRCPMHDKKERGAGREKYRILSPGEQT